MEKKDFDAIQKLASRDISVQRLFEKYEDLHDQVEELEKRRFRLPDEDVFLHRLKKEKLQIRDTMMLRVNADNGQHLATAA